VLDLSRARLSNSTVALTDTTIGTMYGEPAEGPASWNLVGLTYSSLDPYKPAAQLLPWLQLNTHPYHPQPYEQLAEYYRGLGHDEQARAILLAKQRQRRRGLRSAARLWGYAQDLALGYGCRPGRAFVWLIALVTALSTYFAAHPPRATSTSAPHFQSVIYALDILVPVLGLGLRNAYEPTGSGRWVMWTGMLAGRILATTIVAAITRAISRS
jgi:hypothetical protein